MIWAVEFMALWLSSKDRFRSCEFDDMSPRLGSLAEGENRVTGQHLPAGGILAGRRVMPPSPSFTGAGTTPFLSVPLNAGIWRIGSPGEFDAKREAAAHLLS